VPVHTQFNYDKKGNLSAKALSSLGAFFPIEVHVPPQIADVITKSGQTVPNGVAGIGLIDTGATLTCVHEDILIGLGLNPIGVQNSGTANGPVPCNVYTARIVFPTKGWTFDVGRVVGVNLTGQTITTDPPKPIIALLGRNLLERSVFIYNGITGLWTITLEVSPPSST
jgi:predicted aspartyl protease